MTATIAPLAKIIHSLEERDAELVDGAGFPKCAVRRDMTMQLGRHYNLAGKVLLPRGRRSRAGLASRWG